MEAIHRQKKRPKGASQPISWLGCLLAICLGLAAIFFIPSPGAQAATKAPLMIKRAELGLLVEDTAHALQQITEIQDIADGKQISFQTWKRSLPWGEESQSASLTIQVPAARFEQVLPQIHTLGMAILSQSITSEDATQRYADLMSTYRAQEIELLRLQDLVAKSENAPAALSERLLEVETEVQTLTDMLRRLEQSISYSSIHLEIEQFAPTPTPTASPTPLPTPTPTPWNPELTVRMAQTFWRRGSYAYCLGLECCFSPLFIGAIFLFLRKKHSKNKLTLF